MRRIAAATFVCPYQNSACALTKALLLFVCRMRCTDAASRAPSHLQRKASDSGQRARSSVSRTPQLLRHRAHRREPTMNKPKHTQGPWTVQGPEEFGVRNMYRIVGSHPTLGAVYVHAEPITTSAANAALIAAAPDLLAALREIEVLLRSSPCVAAYNVAVAAIALAEGMQP